MGKDTAVSPRTIEPIPIVRRGRGRPSEYLPEYCDTAVEAGAEGEGKAGIAARIGVDRSTIDEWMERYPDFSCAMAQARELSLAWWESQGKAGIWAGKDFNSQAYSLQVRNRFPEDWRERTEQVVETKKEISDPSEAQAIVTALLQELAPYLTQVQADSGKVIDITPKIEQSEKKV